MKIGLQRCNQIKLTAPVRPEVLNLFCILYPLPIEKSIIYSQCNTFTFVILEINIYFSSYFITPSVGKIYFYPHQKLNLPPVKNLGVRQTQLQILIDDALILSSFALDGTATHVFHYLGCLTAGLR